MQFLLVRKTAQGGTCQKRARLLVTRGPLLQGLLAPQCLGVLNGGVSSL